MGVFDVNPPAVVFGPATCGREVTTNTDQCAPGAPSQEISADQVSGKPLADSSGIDRHGSRQRHEPPWSDLHLAE